MKTIFTKAVCIALLMALYIGSLKAQVEITNSNAQEVIITEQGKVTHSEILVTKQRENPDNWSCDDYIVGTGTIEAYLLPITTSRKYSYSQQIFHASELGFLGTEGIVKSVSFQYFHSTDQDRSDFRIYLANTTKETFASISDWIPFSELQLVYSGALHLDNNGDDYWVTIPLTSDFIYTGNNLALVVLDNEGAIYTGNDAAFYAHEISDYNSLIYFQNTIPIVPADLTIAVSMSKLRNNVKFEICGELPCFDHIVGDGTDVLNLPISISHHHNYSQQIFDADELGFSGYKGVIKSVSFQYRYYEYDRRNFNLYLANTTKDTFESNSDWIPFSELQLVYSGALHLDDTGDDHWVTIPLASEFTYTGNNIVVVVLDNDETETSHIYNVFHTHKTSSFKKLQTFNNDNAIDPNNPPSSGMTKIRNNIKFEICEQSHCPEYIVGNGRRSTLSFPIVTSRDNSYTQQIFDASELGFSVSEGVITSVSFQYFNTTPQDRNDFTLYLANTEKTIFESKTDWVPFSELQLVYSGALHLDNTGDDYWVNIPLTTDFIYTGNNIAIAGLSNEENTYTGTAVTFYAHDISDNKAMNYYNSNNSQIDPTNPPAASEIVLMRNNVKFRLCEEVRFPVQNLSVTNLKDCLINISWEEPTIGNILSYNIYCNNMIVGNTTDLSYEHTVSESGTYSCCVAAVYYDGESPKVCADITVTCGVGIEELESTTEKIHPNPATDYTIIESDEDIRYIAIFNIVGEKMYERTNTNEKSVRIDVNGYIPGIYLVKINNRTEKLVVKRE